MTLRPDRVILSIDSIGPGAEKRLFMEEDNNKKSFTVWIYLIPVFILAAWPALQWMKKANSGDIELSKDDYSAFNSTEGEIRKTAKPAGGAPEFDYSVMGVRYKSKTSEALYEKAAAEERERAREEAGKRASAAPAGNQGRGGRQDPGIGAVDPLKAREQQAVGYTQGLLGNAVGKVINNPKAVGAIFSNKYVVSGFMARGSVKAATASPQGLANFLKSGAPAEFLNNSVVKAAMNNPAIVSAVASSGLVSAMLDTPAAKALMNDPKALGDLVASNPELVAMAMSNPNTLSMLMNNPEVSGIVSNFDTSGIKK